jgi:hypothetical protein
MKNQKQKKSQKPKLQEWLIVNDSDANDTFTVEATNANDAAHKALSQLNWWVAKQD